MSNCAGGWRAFSAARRRRRGASGSRWMCSSRSPWFENSRFGRTFRRSLAALEFDNPDPTEEQMELAESWLQTVDGELARIAPAVKSAMLEVVDFLRAPRDVDRCRRDFAILQAKLRRWTEEAMHPRVRSAIGLFGRWVAWTIASDGRRRISSGWPAELGQAAHCWTGFRTSPIERSSPEAKAALAERARISGLPCRQWAGRRKL